MVTQEALVGQIVAALLAGDGSGRAFTAKLGVSNRHVHLSRADLDALFGPGYELTQTKALVQPGQYAAEETVTVAGPKGALQKVRILGPVRPSSQVELLRSDAFVLGVDLPVRDSGCMDPSPSVTLVGPRGSVALGRGVMAAWRHLHLSEDEARAHGLRDGDQVRVRAGGDRAVLFENVKVRAGRSHACEVHLDVDEANSACLRNGDMVEILPV